MLPEAFLDLRKNRRCAHRRRHLSHIAEKSYRTNGFSNGDIRPKHFSSYGFRSSRKVDADRLRYLWELDQSPASILRCLQSCELHIRISIFMVRRRTDSKRDSRIYRQRKDQFSKTAASGGECSPVTFNLEYLRICPEKYRKFEFSI